MNDSQTIASLQAENAALRQHIALLEEKVAFLLDLLQKRNVKKDSQNSHLPPASDIAPKKKQSLRPPSTRKSGGQPGHPGQTRTPRPTPETVTDLKSNFCGKCGTSLADTAFVLNATRLGGGHSAGHSCVSRISPICGAVSWLPTPAKRGFSGGRQRAPPIWPFGAGVGGLSLGLPILALPPADRLADGCFSVAAVGGQRGEPATAM